jgi:hypothetical protein
MATISAKRRPIRDWVERNNAFKRAITFIPGAFARAVGPEVKRRLVEGMGSRRRRVETETKIAMSQSSEPHPAVDLLPWGGQKRTKSSRA